MSKLPLAQDSLKVTTFEVQPKPAPVLEKKVSTIDDTCGAQCTACTACNWTV